MVFIKRLSILAVAILLSACKPESPEKAAGADVVVPQHGFTLTQVEFDGLSPDDQFMVANKALSTLFQGLPLDEFFDLTQGLDNPQIQYSGFINTTQAKLLTPLTSAEQKLASARTFGRDDDVSTVGIDEAIPAAFVGLEADNHPHQVTMAKIQGYPLSKNQFVHWMSYFLANTIMFSPAREMDSTDDQDISRVLSYLELNLTADTPIRDVIKGWLNNLSRWRVSRSPENHALEMFELYLGIFNDTEEEQQNTINGGKACSAWYLTDDGDEYQLKKDPFIDEGVESVKVFDNLIASCAELYDLVAGHPRVIPRVTEVIVNYFLDGSTAASKQSLIQSIVNTGPVTFQDIFLPIIFSREFLLNSERPKTFEENTFGFLHSMHWSSRAGQPLDGNGFNNGTLGKRIMDYMLDSSNNGSSFAVHNMGWAAMDAKIGRTPFLPMDALSFATYHKGIRESVLLNNRAFDGCSHPSNEYDGCYDPKTEEELAAYAGLPYPQYDGAFYVAGTENLKPSLENLNAQEFVDFVFLTALGRRATEEEMDAWLVEGGQDRRDYIRVDDEGVLQLRKTNGEDLLWENRTDDFAEIMLDYISRLPEFYYYRSVTN